MAQENECQQLEITPLSGRLEEMETADDSLNYFAITLTADEQGQVWIATQTMWIGMTNSPPLRDIRRASTVIGSEMLEAWRKVGTPGLAVNHIDDMVILLSLGGNAIVEESLARQFFPMVFEEWEMVRTGAGASIEVQRVDQSSLQRAPTRKLRMRVLKRDDYRCRICGRRPADDTDIQLQVHHFIPWALGGVTDERNLVTLCHTCHTGLNPHYDESLASVFPETHETLTEHLEDLRNWVGDHRASVRRYRRSIREDPSVSLRRNPRWRG